MKVATLFGGALLAAQSVSAIDLILDNEDSVKQATAAIAKNMMTWYKGDESPNAPGLLPQPYYWWNAGMGQSAECRFTPL
jgi:mannan endo-1,6-alpha-mannosidase